MSNELIRELVAAVEAARKAHESLFTQCLTNGVFTQWGQPVDCTALNEAGRLASYALIAKARAYLETGGWTKVSDGLPVVPDGDDDVEIWIVFPSGLVDRGLWLDVDTEFDAGITHWRYAESTPESPKG